MPRLPQLGVLVPLTVIVRAIENLWPLLLAACTVKVCVPAGMVMNASVASEPESLKVRASSTISVIFCTPEADVVPATILAGDDVVLVGEHSVTEGSTAFSGQ